VAKIPRPVRERPRRKGRTGIGVFALSKAARAMPEVRVTVK
jgi:hypothetical protein